MENDKRQNSINDLLTGVGRIEGKIEAQTSSISDLQKTIIKQNGRIGKLEQWRNGIVVAIGLGAFTISVFGGRVWDSFENNRWKATDQTIYAFEINKRISELEASVNGDVS